MKTKLFTGTILCGVLTFFSSCNSDSDFESNYYWNACTLVRMHLYGDVKTLTDESGAVYEFNNDGLVTKTIETSTQGTTTSVYNYSATGELQSVDVAAPGGNSYTTTFSYENNGKFIALHPEQVIQTGLIPNLKSVVSRMSRVDCISRGNEMLLILTNVLRKGNAVDTVVVKYNGQFPVSISSGFFSAKDITYAGNGMFRTYTEQIPGDRSLEERTFFFKPDKCFLLTDSVVCTSYQEWGKVCSVNKYSYDENKNVVREEVGGAVTTHSYEYDSHRNWISRTSQQQAAGSSVWSEPVTVSRLITYR